MNSNDTPFEHQRLYFFLGRAILENFLAWKAVAGAGLRAQEFIAEFARRIVNLIHLVSSRDKDGNGRRFVASIAVSIA